MMERWFFAHLMKTGGTSLFFMLQRQFSRREIFPPPAKDDMISVDAKAALEEMKRPDSACRIVSGHFPLSCVEEGVGQWRTFTLLRHPLDRVLSALRRQSDHDPNETVESIYNNPLRFHLLFDNHMVKMLGVAPEEIDVGLFSSVKPEQRHLDRALAALERCDVIGVQEDFDPFCTRLEKAFGWDLGERLGVNRAGEYDVSDELIERVRADNTLDFELYAHARRLLGLPAVDDLGRPLA
tara:strand:+ start:10396 stop:11112 length:717 start_codon:yes stop_codon:yes gene_type:complete